MRKFSSLCAMLLAGALPSVGQAQIAIDWSQGNVSVQTGKSQASVASNRAGVIEGDVEVEGVTVINQEVFIDGVKVPHGQTRYVGKKSGKTYAIRWGKNGNVAVEEK